MGEAERTILHGMECTSGQCMREGIAEEYGIDQNTEHDRGIQLLWCRAVCAIDHLDDENQQLRAELETANENAKLWFDTAAEKAGELETARDSLKCCPNCEFHGVTFDGSPGVCNLKGGRLEHWGPCEYWQLSKNAESEGT